MYNTTFPRRDVVCLKYLGVVQVQKRGESVQQNYVNKPNYKSSHRAKNLSSNTDQPKRLDSSLSTAAVSWHGMICLVIYNMQYPFYAAINS